MKKNDIGVILAVAIFAGIISLVASNFFFTPQSTKGLKAQKIDPVTAEFTQPDKRFFNKESTNPTQLITIGDNNNTQPL